MLPSCANPASAPALVVSPYTLLVELLADHMAAKGFPVGIRTTSTAAARRALDGKAEGPSLAVLAFCAEDPEEADFITWLTGEHPETNTLVLTCRFDADYLNRCLNAGADGFLYADMSLAGLAPSLALLAAGEKVLPSRLAFEMRAGDLAVTANSEDAEVGHGLLTGRETEVVRLIAGGAPNKEIARTFKLTEASVKMHLRQIFGKLKVQNRTQAAAWAIGAGLGSVVTSQ